MNNEIEKMLAAKLSLDSTACTSTTLINRDVLTKRLDNPRAWLERERQQAVIERVANTLCPPAPAPDDRMDAMRYAFGCAFGVKKDFGVLLINSVA